MDDLDRVILNHPVDPTSYLSRDQTGIGFLYGSVGGGLVILSNQVGEGYANDPVEPFNYLFRFSISVFILYGGITSRYYFKFFHRTDSGVRFGVVQIRLRRMHMVQVRKL